MSAQTSLAVLSLALASCMPRPGRAGLATPTPAPSATRSPTATARPTSTREPPTATALPSATPLPTATPNEFGIDWAIDCENDDLRDGYWFHTTCLPGIVSEDFWLSRSPNHYVGAASYYQEGLMEKVAANRGLSLNGTWGGVATMFCGDIGRKVYLRPRPEGHWQGPYLVVDCSAREHLYYNIIVNQIGLEVDYNTWQRWRNDGPLPGVHLCFSQATSDCGAAYSLYTWFQRNVEWGRPDPEGMP